MFGSPVHFLYIGLPLWQDFGWLVGPKPLIQFGHGGGGGVNERKAHRNSMDILQ